MNCQHPFVYPNGDCTDCGVMATMMPGKVEDYHVMVCRPAQILTFFAGTRPDDKGRMLSEIQDWSNEELEGCHDQIQWMFPAPERSNYNPKAPLLTKEVIERFNDIMRANLSINFMRMMKFYGFEIEENPLKITLPEGEIPYWLNPRDHNLLRLTRIVRSLKLLGMEEESMALFKCLAGIYTKEHFSPEPRITRATFDWWCKAAYAGLEDFK